MRDFRAKLKYQFKHMHNECPCVGGGGGTKILEDTASALRD